MTDRQKTQWQRQGKGRDLSSPISHIPFLKPPKGTASIRACTKHELVHVRVRVSCIHPIHLLDPNPGQEARGNARKQTAWYAC